MGGKGKEAAQRLLAIIVIIAMMSAMGIPPPVIIFFAIVIYFVWRAVQHTERQETNRIFDFYSAANDILRDEERRWYGYEIADVREEGERILREMPDAPPLVLFALGALYHRTGDFNLAHEHLARLVESDAGDENRRLVASVELRRYVDTLRRMEREPADKPQTMAAVRSLERARRHQAANLLDSTRARLAESDTKLVRAADATGATNTAKHAGSYPAMISAVEAAAPETASLFTHIAPHAHDDAQHRSHEARPATSSNTPHEPPTSDTAHLAEARLATRYEIRSAVERPSTGEPRPPITEVLHDLYEEKRTA